MKEQAGRVKVRWRLFFALAGIAVWKGAEAVFPLVTSADDKVIQERLAQSNDEFLKGAIEQRADDMANDIKWDGWTAVGAGAAALAVCGLGYRRPKRKDPPPAPPVGRTLPTYKPPV